MLTFFSNPHERAPLLDAARFAYQGVFLCSRWFRRREKRPRCRGAHPPPLHLLSRLDPSLALRKNARVEEWRGDAAGAVTDPTKPKRRRGSRGGKGRKKVGHRHVALRPQSTRPRRLRLPRPTRPPCSLLKKPPAAQRAQSQRQERRRSQGSQRRREAPRRASRQAAARGAAPHGVAGFPASGGAPGAATALLRSVSG